MDLLYSFSLIFERVLPACITANEVNSCHCTIVSLSPMQTLFYPIYLLLQVFTFNHYNIPKCVHNIHIVRSYRKNNITTYCAGYILWKVYGMNGQSTSSYKLFIIFFRFTCFLTFLDLLPVMSVSVLKTRSKSKINSSVTQFFSTWFDMGKM